MASLVANIASPSFLIYTRAGVAKIHWYGYLQDRSLDRVGANRQSSRAGRSRGHSHSLVNSEGYHRLLIVTSSVFEFLKVRYEIEVSAVFRRVI
jgi:hypothetical protein